MSFPQIAIKLIDKRKASKEYTSKLLPKEMTILRQLNHPHIISTYSITQSATHCFHMLEMAHNGNLRDYCRRRGGILPQPEAAYIFKQVCSAVGYCHKEGIAHRHLKQENILLDKDMNVKVGGEYSYFCNKVFG